LHRRRVKQEKERGPTGKKSRKYVMQLLQRREKGHLTHRRRGGRKFARSPARGQKEERREKEEKKEKKMVSEK